MDETRTDLDGQLLMPWGPVKCTGCGRLLTSEASLQRHMGRTCWRRSRRQTETESQMAESPGSQQEDWL
jgi:hypothetical protein